MYDIKGQGILKFIPQLTRLHVELIVLVIPSKPLPLGVSHNVTSSKILRVTVRCFGDVGPHPSQYTQPRFMDEHTSQIPVYEQSKET